MVGIKGARPNQPKKHTKNISHVIWNVFICMPLRLKMFNLVSGCSDVGDDIIIVLRVNNMVLKMAATG